MHPIRAISAIVVFATTVLYSTVSTTAKTHPIYLEQNLQNGSQLMFNDGSIYEIAPADRAKTVLWLTPIEVTIEPSNDPNYPSKITNTRSKTSVNGKMIKAPKTS
ncbi:MAG TPA: hypothetical protein VFU89_06215 [Rhabdochlamydiaceae bacterium]|nr:hypothetical protein [Rhabdochlamydiaceae bacterium]